ncbi:MAG: ABC transporter permease subunit [Enterocloster bolteae]
MFVVLKYTKFGRSIYAIGGNEQSALLLGLNVRRIKLQAYVLDGLLAGLGGLLFCMNTCSGFRGSRPRDLRWMPSRPRLSAEPLLTGGVGNVIGSLFRSFD